MDRQLTTFTIGDLRHQINVMISTWRSRPGPATKSQAAVERLIEELADDDEIMLAYGILLLHTSRLDGTLSASVQWLTQDAYERMIAEADECP